MEIKQGTFTPLVFSTTGGMEEECKRYHSRLAELLAIKKGEDYSTTIAWDRTKVSFTILRAALLCLRGSRTIKRRNNLDIGDADLHVEKTEVRIPLDFIYIYIYIIVRLSNLYTLVKESFYFFYFIFFLRIILYR